MQTVLMNTGHGEPNSQLSAEEGAAILFEAMMDFYLYHEWFAARVPMDNGEELAKAKRPDVTGLLKAKWLGVNRPYLTLPNIYDCPESVPRVP